MPRLRELPILLPKELLGHGRIVILPGQYLDEETGLAYNYYRDYDPAVGRYVQSDPIGLNGGLNPYLYANGNPLAYADPYGLWAIGDPLPQGVVDAVTGFGDGVSRALTLGFYSTSDYREWRGIDGGVDSCSAWYKGGSYTGYAWGAGTFWTAGLYGGANSVFWSGAGNLQRAANLGRSLESTPIGWVMNRFGERVPYWMWKAASATYAGNVRGTAIKVGAQAGNLWRAIEAPILNWRNIPIVVVP